MADAGRDKQAGHGRHGGRHSGPTEAGRSHVLLRVLLLTLATTATVIVWGYLVVAAVDFGVRVRGGKSDAVLLLVTATLGAVACLFVALILVTRALRTLGVLGRPAPTRSAGRRRK